MAAGFKTATVNASDVPGTLTDYPAYVDLSRLGITTQAEADSVRVYADSAKTTEWAREIVSATEMHVKIPSLTSTTSIYVEWDGVSADYAVGDTYGRNAVWTGYNAVYHMESLTTDYTGNGYTLTDVNTVGQAAGKLNGLAGDFEKTNNESLDISSAVGSTNTSSFAVSCWFTVESAPSSGNYHSLVAQYIDSGSTDKGWRIGYENNAGTLRLRFYKFGTGTVFLDTNVTLTTGSTWYHAFFTWDGSTIRAYKDGAEYANGANTGTAASTSATSFTISKNGSGGADQWDGLIDEVRLYNNVLSSNRITTEYNNQSDESGFWGTWTTVSTANFVSPSGGVAYSQGVTMY